MITVEEGNIYAYITCTYLDEEKACLFIDVYCYKCKKLCAMSNTLEIDGRRYCYKCYETETIFQTQALNDI